jgi:pilus assembly protein CpaC
MNNKNEAVMGLRHQRKRWPAWLASALLVLLGGVQVQAQQLRQAVTTPPFLGGGGTVELLVPLYKSRVVTVDAPANRVSVGNPDIADIVVISPTQLYVLGKDLGTTNVLLWGRDNQLIGAIAVEVQHDLEGLKKKIFTLLPNEPVEVYSSQRSIVLMGRVSDAGKLNAAQRIAEGYLAQIQTAKKTEQFEQESASKREDKSVGQVINLLQVGGSQQVMLEVKVAEIQREELRRLNAQFNAFKLGGNWSWGGVNGGATFPDAVYGSGGLRQPVFPGLAPAGPAVDEFAPNPMTISGAGLFASFLDENFLFNLAIDAAKKKGLAKILAEPTLTTLTGQEADFLSGGEFPVPVPDRDGVKIEYKKFGVGVKFVPVVLSSGQINLKLQISVSEIDTSRGVRAEAIGTDISLFAPFLRTRSANGTVELGDGQSIGLAGLISEDLKEAVTKFPVLGSIPVLGALFRSQDYLKGQTELVIIVTPRLAKPLAPNQIKLPTDAFIDPSDAEFFLLGELEGLAKTGAASKP